MEVVGGIIVHKNDVSFPKGKNLLGDLSAEAGLANRDLPIFMAHGTYDPVLPVELGRFSKETLEHAGFTVEWREYPMAHAVCAEEIAAIKDWLQVVLPEK